MSRMWEVDPETRAKLFQISKTNGNDKCCDCNAPAPQWASPKFGTLICLNCAGTHRGLGVHISFVRSITMDAFKTGEIQRMERGGNEPWKAFFDSHAITQSEGRSFEDSTIKERYEGEVGEEWKERLAAAVEGREFDAGLVQEATQKKKKKTHVSALAEGEGGGEQPGSTRSSTPLSGDRESPAGSMEGFGSDPPLSSSTTITPGAKKEMNEAYFAKLGSENASRSDNLPPSQGGKYTGFGGGLPQPTSSSASSTSSAAARRSQMGPGFDEFQKDPVATLSKGFGWFASAVGKGAKSMNDSYIQPTAKTIAESDLAAQARVQATSVGQNIQVGARGAADSFNRFVEGDESEPAAAQRGRQPGPERKDFWDDFSSLAAQRQQEENSHRRTTSRSSAIGTAAVRGGPSGPAAGGAAGTGTGTGAGAGATGPTTTAGKAQEDWGDDNW